MTMHNLSNVLLPEWIFTQAGDDKNELKRLIVQYIKRYPGYTILKVKGRFAVCEINR